MKKKISKFMGIGLALVLIASVLVFAIPASAVPLWPMAPTLSNIWQPSWPMPGVFGQWFYDPSISTIGPMTKAIDGDIYTYVSFAGTFTLTDNGDILTITAGPLAQVNVFVDNGTPTIVAGGGGSWSAPVFTTNATGGTLTITADDAPTITTGTWTVIQCCLVSAVITDAGTTGNAWRTLPWWDIFKSIDNGRTWTQSVAPGAYRYIAGANPVVDMVCSELYEDVLYVTDGNYVYRSVDGGQNFTFVNKDSLETALMGECPATITGCPITCIDLGYDDGQANVFIGTKYITGRVYPAGHPKVGQPIVGSVYWIEDGKFGAEWTDLQLFCYGCCNTVTGPLGCWDVYAVGCAPNFDTSAKVYAVITTNDDNCYSAGGVPRTYVVYTTGICAWTYVSELGWNCAAANNFNIDHATRIAFPSYYATQPTLFVGVVDDIDVDGVGPDGYGGDVYRVADGPPPPNIAIDLNVGVGGSCSGNATDICSLDIRADDALMAGAWWNTCVYFSYDGGWMWGSSCFPGGKSPTGVDRTYVLWVADSALAATRYCDAAVSMSCGPMVGQLWNQISLIHMTIDQVLDLDHAPGYKDGSSTMYVLTRDFDACFRSGLQENISLFRWDGIYWERVFSSIFYENLYRDPDLQPNWVMVSPDYEEGTPGEECVYLANSHFRMFRTLDAGCSWARLVYPCSPYPNISAWEVVNKETVLASGAYSFTAAENAQGFVFRTTVHGAQPWSKFPVPTCEVGGLASNGVDFDLSPSILASPNGDNDANVLLGDDTGQVFLSKDLGATWVEIQDMVTANFGARDTQTYVTFDPGYGTTGDPGEKMIYAAAGTAIGRCNLGLLTSPFNCWQDWVYICPNNIACDPCGLCLASGIAVAGDTALYVSDAGIQRDGEPPAICGTIGVRYQCGATAASMCTCDFVIDIPFASAVVVAGTGTGEINCMDPLTIVDYDLTCWGPPETIVGMILVKDLVTGTMAWVPIYLDETEPDGAGGATYTCPECTPAGSAVEILYSALTLYCAAEVGCETGVWRTLNPMDTVIEAQGVNYVEWEFLYDGTPYDPISLIHPAVTGTTDFEVYSDDLWITSGSNVLWALDLYGYDGIWTWDDPLATPVILKSPANGVALATTDSVTLEWNALDGATNYEVFLYTFCPECPAQMILVPGFPKITRTVDGTCLLVTGLTPGTKYYWKVRVACDSPFVSKWSELRTFDTALLTSELCSPPCGAENISLTPNFSWGAVPGATGYKIEVATDELFTNLVGSGTPTINAWDGVPALEYGTTYYWRFKAVKDGVESAWVNCLFSTMERPVTPTTTTTTLEVVQEEITPMWIWVIIGIGAALVIVVIVLIVMTRRPS